MTCREYDNSRDALYMPDVTPCLFLSSVQVATALAKIPLYEAQCERDARSLIETVETLNRDEKNGELTSDSSFAKNREIATKFREKHGRWPYQTETYKRFYEQFGCSEI